MVMLSLSFPQQKVVVEHKHAMMEVEDRQSILCTIGAMPTEVRPSIDPEALGRAKIQETRITDSEAE